MTFWFPWLSFHAYITLVTFLIMADPEVQIAIGDDDVLMQGDGTNVIDEVPETGVPAEEEAEAAAEEAAEDKVAPKLSFAE